MSTNARTLHVDPETYQQFVNAYSADRIAAGKAVKGVAFNDQIYTVIATASGYVEARRMWPRKAWRFPHKPQTYAQRSALKVPGRFYNAMLVTFRGQPHVLGYEHVTVRLQKAPAKKAAPAAQEAAA